MTDKPTYEQLEKRIKQLESDLDRIRHVEHSVQKTRDFAKNLVDTVREPLVILDENLKIVTATRSFYRLFRTTPGQIQGKLLHQANNGQWDIPELKTLLEDISLNDAEIEDFKFEHEFKGIGYKILYLNARKTHNDNNKSRFIMLAIDDATERIQTQREILKREARLKEAAHMALLGHWELDLVKNTLYWSDEIYEIFGQSPQSFGATYEAFLEHVHPDDLELVDRAFTSSIKNKTGYSIVHRLLLKDGTVKYVQERCRTEYDEHGNPVRSLGTVQDISEQVREKQGFSGIIGTDPRMRELFETVKDLSDIDVPVLIQGESGTGKELVAYAIHNEGPRAKKPFVPVNCSALPEGLLESELFGHVKGAFTGAIRDKKGRFELAHGGTLFLDEVADLPKVVQAKLLRVLQEGTFERVGDEKTISVDVRLISAANRDLKREVEKGNFRDDLFYRINVVPIYMPALRRRKGDIPLLVENSLQEATKAGQKSKGVSKEALAFMIDYPWPGNVRELQSAIRFAIIKSRGEIIQPGHLPSELKAYKSEQGRRRSAKKLIPEEVRAALAHTGGNKAKAARFLGVGRATLYRFLSDAHSEI
ncbi:hypothetical protein PITCH_A780106 [uncultured Desulfobacterium sp.]|uniref:PAS modulated sigma54 specific transcriptional regulator, Fis family n=1 Tax=uncultured Desulfobacterium sp. TaxID=201089 RepID=A0A445N2S5_9BACT|nr:hypothetical protein PITCH_A780106 [uncultured Desulfobacterium sp.]